jgi:hypothetical protein
MQKRRRVSRKRPDEAEEEPEAKSQPAVSVASSVPLEWGSKQPKPADKDVLRYALTTGGELAQKLASAAMVASATPETVRYHV